MYVCIHPCEKPAFQEPFCQLGNHIMVGKRLLRSSHERSAHVSEDLGRLLERLDLLLPARHLLVVGGAWGCAPSLPLTGQWIYCIHPTFSRRR